MRRLLAIAPLVLIMASCGHRTTPVEVKDVSPPKVVIVQDVMEEVLPEPEPKYVEYRVTAYCSCAKCCGAWAKNRPLDENGNPIVVGSWGRELAAGYSAASPMAFGTKVDLEGFGVVEVQDRTADWIVDKHGENIIDIYMTDHEEALEFGVQYMKGEFVD